jgi:hypothetical protein
MESATVMCVTPTSTSRAAISIAAHPARCFRCLLRYCTCDRCDQGTHASAFGWSRQPAAAMAFNVAQLLCRRLHVSCWVARSSCGLAGRAVGAAAIARDASWARPHRRRRTQLQAAAADPELDASTSWLDDEAAAENGVGQPAASTTSSRGVWANIAAQWPRQALEPGLYVVATPIGACLTVGMICTLTSLMICTLASDAGTWSQSSAATPEAFKAPFCGAARVSICLCRQFGGHHAACVERAGLSQPGTGRRHQVGGGWMDGWMGACIKFALPCALPCVVWCGAVRCGVVWCGVVWCGVVWCA